MSKYLRNGDLIRISDDPSQVFAVMLKEKFNTDAANRTQAYAAVAAAANSGWIDLDNLDPRDKPKELLQIRLGFEDGLDYYVKYPSGTNMHGINRDKDIGMLNAQLSPRLLPNDDYEYWAINGWYPSINAKNETAYADTPRVYAEGMRYSLRAASLREVTAVERGARYCRFIQMGGVQQQEGS